MTAVAETPSGGVDLSALPRPIPEWQTSRRNTVKVVYVSQGMKTPKNLVGRVVSVTPDLITLLRDKTGEPVSIARDRVRSIVVMQEGDVAGRLRVTAVRALANAARALADTRHVGGNQELAADQIALALSLIPRLQRGNPDDVWELLQIMGIDIE